MKNDYLFSMAIDEIRGRKRSSFLIFFVLFLSFTCAMISLSLTESGVFLKNDYLFSMAIDEIRGRKRSSFLIFFVLFLSFTCAMISLSLTESMDKTNEECRYDTYGIWEGAVLNVYLCHDFSFSYRKYG